MLDPNKAVEQMQSEFSAGFQAGAASRDAEVAELQKAIDENWVTHQQIVAASKERDQLRVQIKQKDVEIARLKAIPVRYRRMAFNAQLQDEIAELVAALETVIANAPEPYCAITRAVDAQCRAAIAKVRKP